MARIAYTETDLDLFLKEIYPDPSLPRNVAAVQNAQERGVRFKKEHTRALLDVQEQYRWWQETCRRTGQHRAQVKDMVEEFNADPHNQGRGTWWAVWNGVTYRTNHTGHRGNPTSVLYGQGSREMREAMTSIAERLS
jgi:hypothetical protein